MAPRPTPATTRSPLIPIFLTVLVDVFSMTLVIPLMAIYAESLGATPFHASLLVTVFSAFQLFSGPLMGRASDRFGRKPLLLASQVGTLASLLLMAFAHSLGMLFVARIVNGATAGNLTIAQAYIVDNTKPEHRTRAFGFIGIAFGLGFTFGPAISAYLVPTYGLRGPIYLAAFLSFASVLLTAILLPSTRPSAPSTPVRSSGPAPHASLMKPELLLLFAQFLLYMLAFSLFISGFALFAERTFFWHGKPFGVREIGYVFAYSGFLGMVLQGGLMGRLLKLAREPALVVAGFAALTVSNAALGFTHTVSALALLTVVSAFGNGVLRPVLTSMITKAAGSEAAGLALGYTQSLSSIAAIIAPPIGGALIGHNQLAAWALCGAALSLLGLLAGRLSIDAHPTPAAASETSS